LLGYENWCNLRVRWDAAENLDESTNTSRAARSRANVKFAPFLMKEDMMVGYYFYRFAIPMIQSLLIALGKSSSLICLILKKKEKM
jgi:hypothetical protein